ncbi:hypothetical protein DL769_001249 [Monosporascus sp. CRB-8-3]|nr:hypothetical protein DL769_001249 [Monosporascus sp. CRB-8-3]
MDLERVTVRLEPADPGVDWKAWLINTEEIEPYDIYSGILKMEVTADMVPTGHGPDRRKVIGRCELWLVLREKMRHEGFELQVDRISETASWLSEEIFTTNGNFRSREFGSTTGKVFGLDLEKGDMIWLENIWVGKEYRNHGIAKKMLRHAHDTIQAEVDSCFIITYPKPLPGETDHEASRKEGYEGVLGPFQKMGFRRIGTSAYFLYAPGSLPSSSFNCAPLI